MIKLIKKFLELRRNKRVKKYQRMKSEILCAIAYDVLHKQTKENVTIPAFMIINKRYDDLNIVTPKDLVKTYTQFYLDGNVSGVEL